MKNFLQAFCWGAIVSLTLLGVWLFVVVGIQDANFTKNEQVSGSDLHTLLRSIEAEEDEFFTAQGLKDSCTSDQAAFDGFCVGYMIGFFEAYDVSSTVPIGFYDNFWSSDQGKQAFSNFMDDHPEYWRKPRALILAASLQGLFPCMDESSW